MYISSSFGMNAELPGPGEAPALCQISLCLTFAGRGDRHDPNTTAARSPHSASTPSLAAVELSFAIDLLGLLVGPSSLYVAHSPAHETPYGGSVTRTSASIHSPCSYRTSP